MSGRKQHSERMAYIEAVVSTLRKEPEITPKEVAKKFSIGIDTARNYLHRAKDILKDEEENDFGNRKIVEPFRPTAAPMVCSDGKVRLDVSEFFGITEFGGRCYHAKR